jgi:hypothetical protein
MPAAAARAPSPGLLGITIPAPGPALIAAAAAAAQKNASGRKMASSAGGSLKKRASEHPPGGKHGRTKKPRRAIPENKEFIPVNEQPTDADVVGGRGGRSNHHAGNRPYWKKVLGARAHYRACQSDASKTMIAQDILNYVKLEKRGRFLNLDSENNRWFVLPDAVVLDKIKQALRDKYVPFWAKNMDIPDVEPGSLSSATKAVGAGEALLGQSHARKPKSRSSTKKRSSAKSKTEQEVRNDETNRLGFLLSASKAAPPVTPTAALPTVDDILKFKYDSLPSLAKDRAGGQGVVDTRHLPIYYGATPAMSNPSLGMGMFHSVQHDPGLLASLASLGGSGAFNASSVGGSGISHGFGLSGNTGAPSLGMAVTPAGLLGSFDMRSADYDRILGNSGIATNKSIDLLRSLTGSGQVSLGSLGGVSSFGLMPDSFGATAEGSKAKSPSSSSPATDKGKSNSKNKKTDWNAMFSSALSADKKEEV